jgi:hypothetical protein
MIVMKYQYYKIRSNWQRYLNYLMLSQSYETLVNQNWFG